jgi:intracellular sulfur oxidation DsrE/DsrF family protein
MKKLLILIFVSSFLFGDQKFSDPQPTFDNPRKWVIKLRVSDKETVNHMLGSIYNVLKEYPDGAINISVVAYSSGMRVLKKDYDPATLTRVKSLQEYDVEFVACRNTMATMKWKDDDFIDDLTFVQAGIAEVIERQVGGWIETTPY